MFPHIPGGCRHQESAGHRVLDKFYRRCCDICFAKFEIVFFGKYIVPNRPTIVSKMKTYGQTYKLN